jgi:omega-hydroxy-beta-dihydromenaquinone-9 sulfotransferase
MTAVDRPIFFIGMPRSGTTILFEAFARHQALAWPTKYTDKAPRLPWLNLARMPLDKFGGRKAQYAHRHLGNRFLPLPSEAYGFWNTVAARNFGRSYLMRSPPDENTKVRVSNAVARIASWQHKPRFTAKLTGPARIGFLSAIFPDAKFIHVVRDGRAVVHSLLRVGFWRDKGGLTAPFWTDGPPLPAMAEWERSDRDAGALAAIQWQHVLELAQLEARGLPVTQYTEIRYEDFIARPIAEIQRLLAACELDVSPTVERYISAGASLTNMNFKFRRDFSADYIARLSQQMEPCLSRYGYCS